jgi:hypothetical protein
MCLSNARLHRNERVDHCVSNEMHTLRWDPFVHEVLDSDPRMNEEKVGYFIGNDSVDLLRHGAIEASEPSFDVSDWDLKLCGNEGCGKCRVHVAGHEQEVWALVEQNRLEALHHTGRLDGMAGRADTEHVVGFRHTKVIDEDARHRMVVVLAGVDNRLPDVPAIQFTDDRRHLHEVRASAHHGQDFHGVVDASAMGWLMKRRCRLNHSVATVIDAQEHDVRI